MSQADPRSPRSRQTLIFDADDTLWENGVLFERVIDGYLDWMAHPTLDRGAIRKILDDIEAANIPTLGYGSTAFLHNLAQCLEQLRQRPATADERREIEALAVALVKHEIELMPGVADTLTDLGRRHELLLLTKGAPDEQRRKIEASGLASHFAATHVVREKNARTYEAVVTEHGLVVGSSWMIGNSPKSDILPAREVGLNAVFIPHPFTWVLEHSELDPEDEGVLVLGSFRELGRHF